MNPENNQWIVQIVLPWMNNDNGAARPSTAHLPPAPRWGKKCARSLAFRYMKELGPLVKCRIFNPITKQYEAYVPNADEDGKEGVKVYHGRDADHNPDA